MIMMMIVGGEYQSTPIYFHVLMSLSSVIVKMAQENMYDEVFSWLFRYLFNTHFLVKSLILELWYYNDYIFLSLPPVIIIITIII